MVCKETMSCPNHGYLFPEEAQKTDAHSVCTKCGSKVIIGRVEKMSKSKRNVIDPNTLLEKYGADTTRLFCLFASPPEKDLEWSEQGVEGSFRFLNRLWRLAARFMGSIKNVRAYTGSPDELSGQFRDIYKKTHHTIFRVTRDIEDRFHFNTGISAVMELLNAANNIESDNLAGKNIEVMRFVIENIVLLLSPVVPHITEELWAMLGNKSSIVRSSWPGYRDDALIRDELLIVIQVNGKLRSRFNVSADTDDETIKSIALSDERVLPFIRDKKIRNVILVKNKLVNIVV
jgi:leucyl-tRNA synthetase